MKKTSLLSTVFLLLGCAAKPIPLSKAGREDLRTQKIVQAVIFPSERPRVFTPAAVAGGSITNPLGPDESTAIDSLAGARRNQLKGDPAGVLGHQFLAELRSRKLVDSIPHVTGAEMNLSQKGLAMDFKTLTWTIHFPTPGAGYSLRYEARARLIDSRSPTPLWQGVCNHEANEANGKKTWSELIKNDGANLEKLMDSVVDTCTDQLIVQFQQTDT